MSSNSVADGSKQFNTHTVKVYSELSRVAIANGHGVALRLWTILRALDTTGCGIVSRVELRKAQRVFAVSDADLRYAALQSGNIFFTVYPHRIEYRSLLAVSLALRVKPGRVHELTPPDLRTVGTFKAACYAAWLSGDAPKQISRVNLCKLWNHGDDTLRRWERKTDVNVLYNVVEVDPAQWGTDSEPGPAWKRVPRDRRTNHEGKTYTWFGKGGVVLYRTVNSYRGKVSRLPRGMVRKVNRAVNSAQRLEAAHYGGGTQDMVQVFFDPQQLPANHQLTPGHCVEYADRLTITQRHIYNTWQFKTVRPVSRAYALWAG